MPEPQEPRDPQTEGAERFFARIGEEERQQRELEETAERVERLRVLADELQARDHVIAQEVRGRAGTLAAQNDSVQLGSSAERRTTKVVVDAKGKHYGDRILVSVLDKTGALVDIRSLIPTRVAETSTREGEGDEETTTETAASAAEVELVLGPRFDVDPETKRVSVPKTIPPAELPRLLREIVRAQYARGPSRSKPAKAIQAELKARKEMLEGMAKFQKELRLMQRMKFWADHDRLPSIRGKYQKLEEGHAKVWLESERALADVFSAAADEYRARTGQDVFAAIGGTEAFAAEREAEKRNRQAALVYRYDKFGKGILTKKRELDPKDAIDLHWWQGIEHARAFASELKTLWYNSTPVQDMRLKQRMEWVDAARPGDPAHVDETARRLAWLSPLTWAQTGWTATKFGLFLPLAGAVYGMDWLASRAGRTLRTPDTVFTDMTNWGLTYAGFRFKYKNSLEDRHRELHEVKKKRARE